MDDKGIRKLLGELKKIQKELALLDEKLAKLVQLDKIETPAFKKERDKCSVVERKLWDIQQKIKNYLGIR